MLQTYVKKKITGMGKNPGIPVLVETNVKSVSSKEKPTVLGEAFAVVRRCQHLYDETLGKVKGAWTRF